MTKKNFSYEDFLQDSAICDDIQFDENWMDDAWESRTVEESVFYGLMNEYGNGVKADLKKAIACYQYAAYFNEPFGMYKLALCYFYGKGILENKKRAMNYMLESADAGCVAAMKFLGKAYSSSDGITKDIDKSVYWTEQAANKGDANSQFAMGEYYDKGSLKDKKIAFGWFMKAAVQGNIDAMIYVGMYYADGITVDENGKEAFKWFRRASQDKGNTVPLSCLANCYEFGIGVGQDLEEANRLKEMVADLEDVDIIKELEKLNK